MKQISNDTRTTLCVTRFSEEFKECSDGLEHMLIDRFLLDESRSIEERETIANALCEVIATISAAFNLNLVVQRAGIRDKMHDHFGI